VWLTLMLMETIVMGKHPHLPDNRPETMHKEEIDKAFLTVRGLSVSFPSPYGESHAVDRVSFDVRRGEILGMVGESGSGKSVTATSILRLVDSPGRITAGNVGLHGRDLMALSEREMREIRGGEISMIWQDPMASLNPVKRIGDQLAEAVRLHWSRVGKGRPTHGKVRRLVVEGLRAVNLQDPERRIREYPHQLSGGLLQRVMIAMGLACDPSLLIADEPTTALDVTIQAQILDLLRRLQRDRGMSIILITHDLGVVAETCDRVQVMYAGRIVERATTRQLFTAPQHPYTIGLLNSMPQGTTGRGELQAIRGTVPDVREKPSGCSFHPRCDRAWDLCRRVEPPAYMTEAGSKVRCHLYE